MKVSVTCTSFNRPDLLERTLTSFFKFNTYPIESFVVLDDSTDIGCNRHLIDKFPTVTFSYNYERLGQIKSVDRLMETVEAPYVFHIEEDWEFYKEGFIEDSFVVLNENPSIQCVWLRADTDTNGHPIEDYQYQREGSKVKWSKLKLDHGNGWHGFTFNPTLRRVGDYVMNGPYSNHAVFNPIKPWESEMALSNYFMKRGYIAAIIRGNGYVRHIGKNRGIRA